MSAAARLYWPQQQQTCWHRTALDGNDTVLVDQDLKFDIYLPTAIGLMPGGSVYIK
jgi:hypothetical protein